MKYMTSNCNSLTSTRPSTRPSTPPSLWRRAAAAASCSSVGPSNSSGSGIGTPSTTFSAASSNSMKPAPPASTTPASLSTGNISGVRSRADLPATRAARSTPTSDAPSCAAAWAPSAASRTTVRIVPSIGRNTDKYAAAEAALSASATFAPVPSRAPFSVPTSPRRIWLRMTPLLPRAPIRLPWLMALQVGSSPWSAPSSSATTASSVRAILVPVSPSGTG